MWERVKRFTSCEKFGRECQECGGEKVTTCCSDMEVRDGLIQKGGGKKHAGSLCYIFAKHKFKLLSLPTAQVTSKLL